MIFLTSDFWKGVFWKGVIYKHRDHCGDIKNHMVVSAENITPIDDDELENALRWEVEDVGDEDADFEEIEVYGEGNFAFRVGVEWKESGGKVYEYILLHDHPEMNPQDALDILAENIKEHK